MPLPESFGQTRTFIGYQSFDNPFGGDYQGLKARLETRLPAGFTFDAEWFEEEALNGSDYFVGMRWSSAFDLAELMSGKNPFGGALKAHPPSSLEERLTEPVIRDLKVQSAVSEPEEVEEERTILTSETRSAVLGSSVRTDLEILVGDLIVVDSDNNTGTEDGSFEHPYDTLPEGEDRVEAGEGNLYVFGRGLDYNTGSGGIILPDGASAYGSGALVEGYGGKSLPAGIYPVVVGDGTGPVFTLGEQSTLQGFDITNPIRIPFSTPLLNGYDVRRAGIVSFNKSNIRIAGNILRKVEYGVIILDKLYGFEEDSNTLIENNIFEGGPDAKKGLVYSVEGAAIPDGTPLYPPLAGSPIHPSFFTRAGKVNLTMAGNIIAGFREEGAWIEARQLDEVNVSFKDNYIIGNGLDGIKSLFEFIESVHVFSKYNQYIGNAGDGFFLYFNATDAKSEFSNDNTLGNLGNGISVLFQGNLGLQNDQIDVKMYQINALSNGDNGIYLGAASDLIGTDLIKMSLSEIILLENGLNGMELILNRAGLSDGIISVSGDIAAVRNGLHGVSMDILNFSRQPNLASYTDVVLTNSIAQGNAGDGFRIWINGAQAREGGYYNGFMSLNIDKSVAGSHISIVDAVSLENGVDGFNLIALAGEDDRYENTATISIQNALAIQNQNRGISARLQGKNSVGLIQNVSAISNLNDGVQIFVSGIPLVDSVSDESNFLLDGVRSIENVGHGISFKGQFLHTEKVDVKFLNISSSLNGEDGLNVEIIPESGGVGTRLSQISDLRLEGKDIELRQNAGSGFVFTDGVTVGALSYSVVRENAEVVLEGVKTALNGNDGINLDLLSRNSGGATGYSSDSYWVSGRNVSSFSNSLAGVSVLYGANGNQRVDFGTLMDGGRNSFYDNGTLDVSNRNPLVTLPAAGNYFNDPTPDVGEEISLGVDASNALVVNPHP